MKHNEIGPEIVYSVYDPKLKFSGVVVVDSTVLGPAGGGTRMVPDLSVNEVADLARGMTFKFAIMGLPRGGSKAGIFADSGMPRDKKIEILRAFGRRIAPLLKDRETAIGPDMGVGVDDVQEIYRGAGLENPRSGLFQQVHDGDAAAFHFTGRGVATAAVTAASVAGISPGSCTAALEGFGQVGVGTARYLRDEGVRLVAISTLAGTLHHPDGIDIDRLMTLRREHGDACVQRYGAGEVLAANELYYVPCDLLIPGARPYVIDSDNTSRLRCRIVCPAANIAVTSLGKIELHSRGIVYVPDYIANAGGALASWVDFLRGSFEQAIRAIEKRIGAVTRDVMTRALKQNTPPSIIAEQSVLAILRAAPPERLSFEESQLKIRALLLD